MGGEGVEIGPLAFGQTLAILEQHRGVRIDRALPLRSWKPSQSMPSRLPSAPPTSPVKVDQDIRHAMCRKLEEANYEASLAARRYEAVDPSKRLVARELENRWNAALEQCAHLKERIAQHETAAALRPKTDRAALMSLARDLPATWNAPEAPPAFAYSPSG